MKQDKQHKQLDKFLSNGLFNLLNFNCNYYFNCRIVFFHLKKKGRKFTDLKIFFGIWKNYKNIFNFCKGSNSISNFYMKQDK